MVDTTSIVTELKEKFKIIGRTEELKQVVLAHSVGFNSKNIEQLRSK